MFYKEKLGKVFKKYYVVNTIFKLLLLMLNITNTNLIFYISHYLTELIGITS